MFSQMARWESGGKSEWCSCLRTCCRNALTVNGRLWTNLSKQLLVLLTFPSWLLREGRGSREVGGWVCPVIITLYFQPSSPDKNSLLLYLRTIPLLRLWILMFQYLQPAAWRRCREEPKLPRNARLMAALNDPAAWRAAAARSAQTGEKGEGWRERRSRWPRRVCARVLCTSGICWHTSRPQTRLGRVWWRD